MKVAYQNSLKYKLLQRIYDIPGNVIFRKDFQNLSDSRQLTRAFQVLIQEGVIAKISYGIYAKVRKSKYIDGVILNTSFAQVVVEALDKMDVGWDLTKTQKAYNTGQSTQVPVHTSLRLKKRMRRKFEFKGQRFAFEDNINAR